MKPKFFCLQAFFGIFLLALTFPVSALASAQFTYDAWHRLVQADYTDNTGFSYVYDDMGNRLSAAAVPAASVVYMDAEDQGITGWDVVDADPPGAAITNMFDADRGSRVIVLTGSGTDNGYRLRKADFTDWNAAKSVLEWSMKFDEPFIIQVTVQTAYGVRYLTYTPTATDSSLNGTHISHGLGPDSQNNAWQTIVRDLDQDLRVMEPGNTFQIILNFVVCGSGRLDDIKAR